MIDCCSASSVAEALSVTIERAAPPVDFFFFAACSAFARRRELRKRIGTVISLLSEVRKVALDPFTSITSTI